jgi:DNA-binding CsgD family transcriptional regulator
LPFDVFALNPDNRYFLQNSICKKNWGDLIGKCPEDLPVNKKTLNIWMNNNRRALSGEKIADEVVYDRLDGRKNFYYNIIAPICDGKKILGIVGVLIDISDLKQAEGALRKAHDELESRVKERTRELKIEKSNLEEANIAMKVLLRKREEDKKDIGDNVLTNVRKLIDPYLDKIKKTKLDGQQKAFLNIMESNLHEITSQFARKISLRELNLTPTEIQIANMIRNGNPSKEIAGIMNVSIRTVDAHRRNIRKKMGLNQKRANLRSYLLSLH